MGCTTTQEASDPSTASKEKPKEEGKDSSESSRRPQKAPHEHNEQKQNNEPLEEFAMKKVKAESKKPVIKEDLVIKGLSSKVFSKENG